jgi:hypothetical protein
MHWSHSLVDRYLGRFRETTALRAITRRLLKQLPLRKQMDFVHELDAGAENLAPIWPADLDLDREPLQCIRDRLAAHGSGLHFESGREQSQVIAMRFLIGWRIAEHRVNL